MLYDLFVEVRLLQHLCLFKCAYTSARCMIVRKKNLNMCYSWSHEHKCYLITLDWSKKKKKIWCLHIVNALREELNRQRMETAAKPVCLRWCVIWRYCRKTVHQNCSSLVYFHIVQIGKVFFYAGVE